MPLKTTMDPKTGRLKTYSISPGGSIVTEGIGGRLVPKFDQPRKVKELAEKQKTPGFKKP
jgi:hypothetical protein